jgi:hypothetical protein
MNEKSANNGAGKGDKPRSCFSHRFKENYDSINWSDETDKSLIKKQLKNKDHSSIYIYR